MTKKKKNKKNTKRNIILIILLIILIIFLSLPLTKNKNILFTQDKKYFTGELLSPNFSANLLDSLKAKENVAISPYNYISSLAILYNGSDNNTSKELKKYLKKDINSLDDLIIPTLNELSNNPKYDSTISSYYETIIYNINSNNYNEFTLKDIQNLSSNPKKDLLLELTKAKMTYELMNGNNLYDLSYIKNYTLTKEDQALNDYDIYNLLTLVIENYSSYQTKNIIQNNNIILYNKNNISITKEYQKTISKYSLSIINYDDKTDIKLLNEQLKQQTYYSFYLDEDILNNNNFILLNSLYIEYNFAEEFDYKNTTDSDFYPFNSDKILVPTMFSTVDTYLENYYAYGIVKPFQNNKYSFIAILPKEEGDFELSNLSLDSLLKNEKKKKIYYSLPKFSYSQDTDLISVLKNNNLNDLISNKSNLSIISDDPISINYYHQKINFQIGEKGTKDSSYNSKSSTKPSNHDKLISFNRPFAYLIIDNSTNNVLLIGKVTNPLK